MTRFSFHQPRVDAIYWPYQPALNVAQRCSGSGWSISKLLYLESISGGHGLGTTMSPDTTLEEGGPPSY